jgi:glycosyltransferase involved in cell wall biosynthesis
MNWDGCCTLLRRTLSESSLMRVLYSFPHKLGADRICYTAWEQVKGIAAAGAEVVAMPGALSRPVPASVSVRCTLARGKLRIPYKLLGKGRALALHDRIVSRRLEKLAGKVDVIHVWPSAALETIRVAKRLGIPTVLERPNAHTRFCYEVVAAECKRIGVGVPHHDYEPNPKVLAREEAEFESTDYLLCPSEFTAQSFLARGFSPAKLLRHRYGFDEHDYFPETEKRNPNKKFNAIYVGVDAVRKGLHFALEAWLGSSAAKDGTLLIAGGVSSEFQQRFAESLAHPSVVMLGHRNDIPALMRQADILLLPSIEEGFGLVCVDAIVAGCVPLVSKACTDQCKHMQNALVHEIGDVSTLREHISLCFENAELLDRLRTGALRSRDNLTWTAAGKNLLEAYEATSRPALPRPAVLRNA